MEQITINNIKIDVIRKDIKYIHLAVYPPTGRVRIAAPLIANDDAIRLFAISKLSWIKRHQRQFEGQERTSPREYKNRESHYFQGRRYLLNIIEKNATPQVIIKNSTTIDLYVRPNTPKEKCHKIMNKWYRALLKTQTATLVAKWEKALNLKLKEFQIRQMKTKWGSCHIEKQSILLNLELAKKPEHCLEYIIVHEMLHLFERHHNERFIFLMNTHYPHWKKTKKELNKIPVSHADWSY